MTIVDAHHHIWRRADLPWLLGPTVPRIFGPYDALKRDYTMGEFLADVEGTGVTRSVYVQANWAPNWFADEAAFVSRVAVESGWPHAISAFCDMRQEDARRDLDRLAEFPLVRAIRHQMHHHHNPLYRFAPSADTVGSPEVIQNVSRLADYGFAFELQVFAAQVGAAQRLVEAAPEVTFILQHAGMLEDFSEEGRQFWREAIGRLAALPNVVCKLSGLGTFKRRNDPDLIAWTVAECLAMFGADRCLYGSN
ncbi:MAG: amidohydrolase family protein, partial [Pseudomonadota bacterium]